jgi:uncharacterized protein (TIGR02328 family)
MRLWHYQLLPYLPLNQLRGQYRECCPLRGKYWGKKHAIIQYIFKYNYYLLWSYHLKVMSELQKRKPHYKLKDNWLLLFYRGKDLKICDDVPNSKLDILQSYPEHNDKMLEENLNNLKYAVNDKGKIKNIDLFQYFPNIKDHGKYDREYWLSWFRS